MTKATLRRVVPGIALAFTLTAATPLGAQPARGAPAAAEAEGKRHFQNGLKLFQDKNYAAAIVEFEAAHRLAPSASKLQNIALAYKELFNYPRSIAALEKMLVEYGATMPPEDQKAARDAIAEMRALLGFVTIRISPAQVVKSAVISIDGDPLPPGAAASPVAMSPGRHRVTVRQDGYAEAEQTVEVVSGARDRSLSFQLVADKGSVVVRAPDSSFWIAVDSKPVGRGTWYGMLAPGPHLVQIYKPGGPSHASQVLVVAGQGQEVRPGAGTGVATTQASFAGGAGFAAPPAPGLVRDVPPPPPRVEPAVAARKWYAIVGGGPIVATNTPEYSGPSGAADVVHATYSDAGGGVFSARVGRRVAPAFWGEVALEIASITGTGLVGLPCCGDVKTEYALDVVRFGPNVRWSSQGARSRWLGAVGTGLARTKAILKLPEEGTAPGEFVTRERSDSGIDLFLQLEAGHEWTLGNFLLAGVVHLAAQGTKGLSDTLYNGRVLPFLGLSFRLGYTF